MLVITHTVIMKLIRKITLSNLPKVSANKFYAGTHWTKRAELKRIYEFIIKSKIKDKLPLFDRKLKYHVDYTFTFNRNPLDATNCSAMIKMIEDILFDSDKHDIVIRYSCGSVKGCDDNVFIEIFSV